MKRWTIGGKGSKLLHDRRDIYRRKASWLHIPIKASRQKKKPVDYKRYCLLGFEGTFQRASKAAPATTPATVGDLRCVITGFSRSLGTRQTVEQLDGR